VLLCLDYPFDEHAYLAILRLICKTFLERTIRSGVSTGHEGLRTDPYSTIEKIDVNVLLYVSVDKGARDGIKRGICFYNVKNIKITAVPVEVSFPSK